MVGTASERETEMSMTYFRHLFVAFDQLLNAICNGWPDETISAHMYRLHRDGKPWGVLMRPINVLFWWQGPEHCKRAYDYERDRTQIAPEYRT